MPTQINAYIYDPESGDSGDEFRIAVGEETNLITIADALEASEILEIARLALHYIPNVIAGDMDLDDAYLQRLKQALDGVMNQ